jgi:hypothetical protein
MAGSSAGGLEYPAQDYFPRWRLRLAIRFSEFGQLAQLQSQAPSKLARSLAGVDMTRDDLQVVPDPSAPPGVSRFILQAGSGSPVVGGPQDQTQSSDGFTQVLDGLIPTHFGWKQTTPRTPGSLEMDVPFASCPFDPRTIRACAVSFFLGTVQAGGSTDDLADTWTDANGQQRTNLRFVGWVDKWDIEWPNEGPPMLHLECVDNARLLIDLQAPTKGQLDATLPIEQAVAKYLAFAPTLAGLSVEYRPTGEKPPIIKGLVAASAMRVGEGPPVSRGAHPGEKMSVFDYLSDNCLALGHKLFMDGTTLVIQRLRSLTSANVQGRDDDPYKTRTLPSGVQLPYRRFIYGRNVKSLRVGRNFTAHPPQNVSVRAYNTEQKQVLVERFPLAQDAQVVATPGDAVDNKWLEVWIGRGVIDRATMRAYAQEVYESMGRQELSVEVRTPNLSSYGGGNDDPDVLDMKFGDPVEVLFNREDYYSSLSALQQKLDSVAANAAYFEAQGFSPQLSQAYAKAYTNSGMQTVYRLHELEVQGGIEGVEDAAVQVTMSCVNYVEVTSDKSLAPGEEPAATSPAAPPAAPLAPPPPAGTTPSTGSGL